MAGMRGASPCRFARGRAFDPATRHRPAPLLDRQYFFAPERVHDCYAMAGEFTGFLIRRFGWVRYRLFYRRADRWKLRSSFRRNFGLSLEAAWERCGDEAVAMVSLNRKLREDRLFNVIE